MIVLLQPESVVCLFVCCFLCLSLFRLGCLLLALLTMFSKRVCRLDITIVVDWEFTINYLSVSLSIIIFFFDNNNNRYCCRCC